MVPGWGGGLISNRSQAHPPSLSFNIWSVTKHLQEQSLKIENLDEQSPKKKKLTKDQVNKLVERALENAKLKVTQVLDQLKNVQS